MYTYGVMKVGKNIAGRDHSMMRSGSMYVCAYL